MENLPTITNIIGQYGFPIVACGALFWYIVTEQRATRKVMEELKKTIEDNTKMVNGFFELVKELTRNG